MSEPYVTTELTITTANPELLDETIQQLPMCTAAVIDDSFNGTTCVVRVFGGLGFLKFALERQGYGKVIKEETV